MAGKAFNLGKLLVYPVCNSISVSQRGIARHVKATAFVIKKRQKIYLEQMKKEERLELNRRSNFIDWNYSSEIYAFGKRLHEEFTPELLVQAFTHRSYIVQQEMKQKEVGVKVPNLNLEDNNELASEGEKIISHYVPRYVSHFFPRFPLEGIESVHKYLASEVVLADISKNLGTTFLILSADYPVELPTYAQTLKAIIGALNKCQGLERARLFVRDFIITYLAGKDINDFLDSKNSFQVLSEILKKDGKAPPEPRLICESAVKTILANYHVGIYSDKKLIGHCSGETTDIAVEMAAFDALKRLFHTTDSCSPITYELKEVPETISNLTLCEWNSAAFERNSELTKTFRQLPS